MTHDNSQRWQFWVDRGGTFTDVIGRRPLADGGFTLLTHKLLSENPESYADAAVAGMRHLLGLGVHVPITPEQVECVKMGTTVATNALLERRGVPTLLLVNRGFADLLRIGDQHRPDLFALRIDKPDPLEQRVLEVGGRLAADGTELEPLQCDGVLAEQLRQALLALGVVETLTVPPRGDATDAANARLRRQQTVWVLEQVTAAVLKIARAPASAADGSAALKCCVRLLQFFAASPADAALRPRPGAGARQRASSRTGPWQPSAAWPSSA